MALQASIDDATARMIFESPLLVGYTMPLFPRERWPHYVHRVNGRVIYTAPDSFCGLEPVGPSDCVWIVPGTA